MDDSSKGGTGKRRDNFTQSAINILFKRAGGKCSKCHAATFGPVTNNPNKYRNIGQAAHIAAAAPGGPRYDPNMTTEERTSVANGLWLCSNCHDQVDRDVEEFTTRILKQMKKRAEDRARREIGVASVYNDGSSTPDALNAGVSAAAIMEIRKGKVDIQQAHGDKLTKHEAEKFLDLVEFISVAEDSYHALVGRELMTYLAKVATYSYDASVALEVIRRLKDIADTYHDTWSREDVELISDTAASLAEKFNKTRLRQSTVSQSAIALLKDLSTYKELQQKKLTSHPREQLAKLKGRDETDAGPLKRKRVDTTEKDDGRDEKYVEIMDQLVEAEDTESALRLEAQLEEMGYESQVL